MMEHLMTVAQAEAFARARGFCAYINEDGRHCYAYPHGSVQGSTQVDFTTPVPTVARASVEWIFEEFSPVEWSTPPAKPRPLPVRRPW